MCIDSDPRGYDSMPPRLIKTEGIHNGCTTPVVNNPTKQGGPAPAHLRQSDRDLSIRRAAAGRLVCMRAAAVSMGDPGEDSADGHVCLRLGCAQRDQGENGPHREDQPSRSGGNIVVRWTEVSGRGRRQCCRVR